MSTPPYSEVDPTAVLSCITNLSLEAEAEILNEILINDQADTISICKSCDELSQAHVRCKDCEELLCNNCLVAHQRVTLTRSHCIIPLEHDVVSPSTSAYSSGSNLTSNNGVLSNGPSPNPPMYYTHFNGPNDTASNGAASNGSSPHPMYCSNFANGPNPTANNGASSHPMYCSSPAIGSNNEVLNNNSGSSQNLLHGVNSASAPNLSNNGNIGNGASSNSMYLSNPQLNCDQHLAETVRMYCDNCSVVFCRECNLEDHKTHGYVFFNKAVENARSTSLKLIANAKMSANAAREVVELTQRMLDTINLRSQSISREISNMMRRFRMAIEDRERELLCKVERIRACKYRAIQQQVDNYKSLYACFSQSSKILSEVLKSSNPLDIIQVRDNVSNELERLKCIRANLPYVDDTITVTPPDSGILLAISTMGDVSPSYTPTAIGEEMLRNMIYRPPPTYRPCNSRSNSYEDTPPVVESLPIPVKPEKSFRNGSRFSQWTGRPTKEQNNAALKPYRSRCENRLLSFRPHRDYTTAGNPVLILDGEADSKLCRPWGVCCNAEGHIIVADRSNNRIQIFTSDGTFIRKFGSYGTEPGYFDRPAGIAVCPEGRLVISDKDNHRIQIFTQDGTFLSTFGEKGSKIGQFNYPWDVDVDSDGRIVVSDTRNHRVQLFDNEGKFIAKYGYENTMLMTKQFDSPRGVCFGINGCVIVTDFNNHRLVVIDSNFQKSRTVGGEGVENKQFLRPQGVVVDKAGNIIVADSRNHRIQVFEPNGDFIHKFGVSGVGPGNFDRPSGICLTPDGKIVVVDFGNNRIQVF